MRLNSKREMKHWLINVNTGRDHKCMSWSKQGGRDAIIPQTQWKPGELEAIKKSVRRKDEIRLAATEALFKPNISERKPEPQPKPEPQKKLT
jgi:hypothetical protein